MNVRASLSTFNGDLGRHTNILLMYIFWDHHNLQVVPDLFVFYGVPDVQETLRELLGAGALHSDRI